MLARWPAGLETPQEVCPHLCRPSRACPATVTWPEGALCARWAERAAAPEVIQFRAGPGRAPKWRSPRGGRQGSQSQVSLTSSASGRAHPRPHCCSAQRPSPPALSPAEPAPSLTGASFWSRAPSRSRDAGRGSGPAGASPAPAGWCLEPLPVVHQPLVPGGLCPREGGSFRVFSQHIL